MEPFDVDHIIDPPDGTRCWCAPKRFCWINDVMVSPYRVDLDEFVENDYDVFMYVIHFDKHMAKRGHGRKARPLPQVVVKHVVTEQDTTGDSEAEEA